MMYAPNDEMSIDYQQIDHMTHVNLVIKKTLPSHSGKYECQLISSEIQLHHVTLTVLSKYLFLSLSFVFFVDYK